MKKIPHLLNFLTFVGLFHALLSCEKEIELSTDNDSNWIKYHAMVNYQELPQNLFDNIAVINPNYASKSFEFNNSLLVDWNEILKVVDTSDNTKYSVRCRLKTDPPSVFYNLILGDYAGETIDPYVIKYDIQNFEAISSANGLDFSNLNGVVSRYTYSNFLNLAFSNNEKMMLLKTGQEEEPCESTTFNGSSGGSNNSASEEDPNTTYVYPVTSSTKSSGVECEYILVGLMQENGVLVWSYFINCADGSTYTLKGLNDDCPDTSSTSPVNAPKPCQLGYIRDSNGNCIPDCPDGQVKNSFGNCVTPCYTSAEDLKALFPTTSSARLQEIADAINTYGRDFGIDTKEKLQHFLAQAGHESANFSALEENLNYRWEKLGTDYWKKYFNPISDPNRDPKKENPTNYKRSATSNYVDVVKFANRVYNDNYRKHPIGNMNSGDGYKFRGRGIIQLTGRTNYQNFNNFYQQNYDESVNLLDNPDLISNDINIAVISALWFFKNNVMNNLKIDTSSKVEIVSIKINGGTHGIENRKEIYTKSIAFIDCL